MKKLVSVIIPSYNRGHILSKTIPTFFQEGVHEIIVVDDMSTDNTQEVLSELKNSIPILKYIRAPYKGYQMGAKNIGIENATGEYCLFGDDDCVLKPNSISHMLNLIEMHPNVIIAARHLVLETMEDMKKKIDDEDIYPFISIEDVIDLKNIVIHSEKKFDQIIEVPFCMQTFMLPTRIARQQKFWNGYVGTCNREETDYQMQICKKFGYKILLDNESLAIDAPRNLSSGGIRSVSFFKRQILEIYNEYNFWRRNEDYIRAFNSECSSPIIQIFKMVLKKFRLI